MMVSGKLSDRKGSPAARILRPIVAVVGAFASLMVLVPYLHPLYAFVTALNIGILVALLWLRWPSANLVGT